MTSRLTDPPDQVLLVVGTFDGSGRSVWRTQRGVDPEASSDSEARIFVPVADGEEAEVPFRIFPQSDGNGFAAVGRLPDAYAEGKGMRLSWRPRPR